MYNPPLFPQYIVSRLGSQAILDTTPDDATPLHFCTCK